MDYPRLILMDLLTAAVADLAERRSEAAERLMPVMASSDEQCDSAMERLQRLAELVGLTAAETTSHGCGPVRLLQR